MNGRALTGGAADHISTQRKQEVAVCLSETAETHSNTDLQLRAQRTQHT